MAKIIVYGDSNLTPLYLTVDGGKEKRISSKQPESIEVSAGTHEIMASSMSSFKRAMNSVGGMGSALNNSTEATMSGKVTLEENEVLLLNIYIKGFKTVIDHVIVGDDEVDGYLNAPKEKGGCYVATAVYGSYDCPEVWTLRRFRDCSLAKTFLGRMFIRTYYAISPTLVKWFGNTNWFKRMWKNPLDKLVEKLQKQGFESTPYRDK